MTTIAQHDEKVRVHIALAIVSVLFSLNYILAKYALAEFDPLAFAWIRVAGSSIMLLLFVRWRGGRAILERREWKAAALYSLLGVVLNQLMFVSGLSMTSAHEAAILITTIPIFTLAVALALRTERASAFTIGGILLAAAGALVIVGGSGLSTGGTRLYGNVLILLNCLSYGSYLVVSRPLLKRASATTAMTSMFIAGTVMLLPFTLPSLLKMNWGAISPGAWAALLGVIAGPTVAAYLLNAWALARAESSMVAVYTYVQPFLASVLAWLILGEHLHARVFLAAVLIIGGVWLTTRQKAELVVVADGVGDAVALRDNDEVNESEG